MNRGKLFSWTIIRDRVDHLISACIRRCVARLGFQVALATALVFCASAQADRPSSRVGDFKTGVQLILGKHCYDCHNQKKTKGKVDLTELTSWADLERNPLLVEKMIGALGKNEMPPEEETQPSDSQRKFMLSELNKAFQNAVAHSRGQVVIPLRLRGMNRFEYGNAVRDLLSYSKGRELTLADRIAAGEIAEASKRDHYRMRSVIKNVVIHPIFTQIIKP